MKKCPYCGKEIQDKAIKCRYCGIFLETTKNIKTKNIINKNLNTNLLIVLSFVVLLIFGYLLYNSKIKIILSEKDRLKIMKSVVKINYFPNGYKENYYIGSGIMFSKDGLILTNSHVISDDYEGTSNGKIKVCTLDNINHSPNCSHNAILIIRNPTLDIAILKIENFTTNNYIEIFNNKGVNTNDFGKTIQIYGYPDIGGDSLTITTGIISGYDQNNNIKTDAEINGGNSGGGAFLGEQYVGIPSKIYYDQYGYGKIGTIISDKQIYNWFYSVLKNPKKTNFSFSDFSTTNLIFGNFDTINLASKNYSNYTQECINFYGKNSYYDEYYNGCDCIHGFEFGEDDICTKSDN